MRSILHYMYAFLTDGSFFVMLFSPCYLFLRMFYLSRKKHKTLADKDILAREFVMFGFFVFLIMLFTQTFIVNEGTSDIRLIPFQIITEQILNINTDRQLFIFNIFGNIAIFIPIGFMTSYLFRQNMIQALKSGFFISLFIETVQIPLERTTDVDDLILNTTGAVIGYFIFRLVQSFSD